MKLQIFYLFILTFTISNSVHAQTITFTDENLLNALINKNSADIDGDGTFEIADANGDGQIQLSEAENVKGLRLSGNYLDNAEGLEFFININYLKINSNKIKSLPTTSWPNLEILLCSWNELTTLDLSNNQSLIELDAEQNSLTSISIEGLTDLELIYLDDNVLEEVNLVDLPSLTEFELRQDDPLNTIVINENPALKTVRIYGTVDLLDVSKNGITSLRVDDCNARVINGSYNALEKFTTNTYEGLEELNLSNNNLNKLEYLWILSKPTTVNIENTDLESIRFKYWNAENYNLNAVPGYTLVIEKTLKEDLIIQNNNSIKEIESWPNNDEVLLFTSFHLEGLSILDRLQLRIHILETGLLKDVPSLNYMYMNCKVLEIDNMGPAGIGIFNNLYGLQNWTLKNINGLNTIYKSTDLKTLTLENIEAKVLTLKNCIIDEINLNNVNLNSIEIRGLRTEKFIAEELNVESLFLNLVNSKKLTINNSAITTLKSYESYLPKTTITNCPLLESLNLSLSDLTQSDQILDHELIVENTPELSYYKIYNGIQTFRTKIASQPKLETIEIYSKNSMHTLDLKFDDLPELTNMSIDGPFISDTLAIIDFPKLQTFMIPHIGNFTLILEDLPELLKVNLGGTKQHISIRNNAKMEYLSILGSCNTLNLEGLPSLKDLIIDAHVPHIVVLDDFPDLEELEIRVSSRNIHLNNLPALKSLVSDARYINREDGTMMDFSNLKSLENIFLTADKFDVPFNNYPIDLTGMDLLSNFELGLLQNSINLDVSKCPNLSTMRFNNNVDTLNVSNVIGNLVHLLGFGTGSVLCIKDESEDEFVVNVFGTILAAEMTVVHGCEGQPNRTSKISGIFTFEEDGICIPSTMISAKNFRVDVSSETFNGQTFVNEKNEFCHFTKSIGSSVKFIPNLTIPYYTVEPPSQEITFDDVDQFSEIEFCIQPLGAYDDIEIAVVPIQQARPGFLSEYEVLVKNVGTTDLNDIDVQFQYPEDVMTLILSTLPSTSIQNGIVNVKLDTLQSLRSSSFILSFDLNRPTDIPALIDGDVLNLRIEAFVNQDETPDNNIVYLNQNVVNSYDPNDKTALLGEKIDIKELDQYVYYLIRFENIGTANAVNIIVEDLIDKEVFDINTFQPIETSHSCEITLENGQLTYKFPYINLPYLDEVNDGYILFKIKPRGILSVGDLLENKADIYFDYNDAIVTNNFTTTVVDGITHVTDTKLDFLIYPNPVSNILTINTTGNLRLIRVIDQSGNLIQTSITNNISTENWSNGIYIIEVITNNEIVRSQVIKM